MSIETQKLLATCDTLASSFAERASTYDNDASFPKENYDELKKAGMLGLMVPEAFGGFGADFYQYTLAAGKLADRKSVV